MQLLIFSVCDTGQICLILIFFAQSGVKIREHKFLTGHKFTNLLKSVSLFMTIIHSKRKFWLVSLLERWEMASLHLQQKQTLLEKTSKWNKLFLKKYQKLFNSHIFFFMHVACTAILSLNWKNNNTIFAASKIQTIRKLNDPTTTLIRGVFLVIVRFNWLKS